MKTYTVKTYKNGNSVVIGLPKALGISEQTTFNLSYENNTLTLTESEKVLAKKLDKLEKFAGSLKIPDKLAKLTPEELDDFLEGVYE